MKLFLDNPKENSLKGFMNRQTLINLQTSDEFNLTCEFVLMSKNSKEKKKRKMLM